MSKGKIIFGTFGVFILAAALFAVYTWVTLTYTYSTGKRAGFLQKFSKRGWVCKTWEGEIVTGNMLGNQEKFQFSVRDPEIAKQIGDAIGKRVEIDYKQHVGIPTSCFGETEYFAYTIKEVADGIKLSD